MVKSDTEQDKIKAFKATRDKILLAGDVDRFIAFYQENLPHLHQPSSREVAEMAMHKCITAVMTLPRDYRLQSKQWLTQHNCHSLDDGDLDE